MKGRCYLLTPRKRERLCFVLWCDRNPRAVSRRSLDYLGDEGRSPWGFRLRLLSCWMDSLYLVEWSLYLNGCWFWAWSACLIVVVLSTSLRVRIKSAKEFAGARAGADRVVFGLWVLTGKPVAPKTFRHCVLLLVSTDTCTHPHSLSL